MRIVQIIDSLEAGGAERMAVNYANGLTKIIDFSGFIATRKEGDLKESLISNVDYLFLNKKSAIDFSAVYRLKKYCECKKIDYVHLHGSSFFIGFLLKILAPNVKLVWHEHYGNRVKQNLLQYFPLYVCSYFFSIILVVNHKLEIWARKKLLTKKIFFIQNYPIFESNLKQFTTLKGVKSKRIVCLANFKKPKNHLFLIKIAKKIKESNPDWTFHLIGKVYKDDYFTTIKNQIQIDQLENNVFIYDSKSDIENILNQATIAILTSESEGLPVSILEYGLAKKAVVATNVGEVRAIIQNNFSGFVTESNDVFAFSEAILKLINNPSLRIEFGLNLNKIILNDYAQTKIMQEYLKILNNETNDY